MKFELDPQGEPVDIENFHLDSKDQIRNENSPVLIAFAVMETKSHYVLSESMILWKAEVSNKKNYQ